MKWACAAFARIVMGALFGLAATIAWVVFGPLFIVLATALGVCTPIIAVADEVDE